MKGTNRIILYSRSDELFNEHGRYSYKVFNDLTSLELDLSKLLLNNCSLNGCKFITCNLNNSDFEGSEFENSIFSDVSFLGADISSCRFRNCIFEKCSFDSTNILDNEFSQCLFDTCSITTSTINNNVFRKCQFSSFCPSDTALYSNDFIQCKFRDSQLLTAIYYTLFFKCQYINTVIDSYILGFQFGLRRPQLKRMKIEHFGQADTRYKTAMRLLKNIYCDRKLKIEERALEFIESAGDGNILVNLLHDFFEMIREGYILKVDEIKFIRRIINFTYHSRLIPPYFYCLIIEDIRNISLFTEKKNLSDNAFNETTLLCHTLYSINFELTETYRDIIKLLLDNRKLLPEIHVEFIYKQCPQYRLSSLFSDAFNTKLLPRYERVGSFIEGFQFVIEHLDKIAALVTILGVGVVDVVKLLWRVIRKKRKSVKEELVSYQEHIEVEEKIISQTINCQSDICKISTESNNLINHDDMHREIVFNSVKQTIIRKKKVITRDYDTQNIKKINFK